MTLNSWQNFYVIVGSSAGALTGLQFVVITLLAQTRTAGSMREVRAFGTPTVIHFCTALLLSALMTAPWSSLNPLAVVLGVVGMFGTIFSANTIWHAYKSSYNPDLEDWLWYTAFPLLADFTLVVAAFLLLANDTATLITIAVDSIFFLVLGIHNSWDSVTFMVIQHVQKAAPKPPKLDAGTPVASSYRETSE